MSETTLALTSHTATGSLPLSFEVQRLYLGGWAGRSKDDVQRHIAELAEIGVSAPTEMPILMQMPRHLVTTGSCIEVRDAVTSGEVEYVLLYNGEQTWVTVGSDHTDRDIERIDIAKSKQLYPNVIAAEVWPYDEVRDHWDSLELACWVEAHDRFTLYQQGLLAALLSAETWLETLRTRNALEPGSVLFSGSLATIGGALVHGDAYRFTLTDAVLGRTLEHSYRVQLLGGWPEGDR